MTEPPRRPWYAQFRYIVLIGVLAILLVVALFPVGSPGPKTRNQVTLDGAVAYFARNYNSTLGLIPESPGSNVYWLFSDNYLAALAVGRYSTNNQSTINFASVLNVARNGYSSTLPVIVAQSQYQALNSSKGYFGCSADYTLSWSTGGSDAPGRGSAVLMTTSNDQGPKCATQNYADLLFLQAVYYHRTGSNSQALSLYHEGATDFDGSGMRDTPYLNATSDSHGRYQTYKLALYLYAGTCLGQQASDPNLGKLLPILYHQQDNVTGGFDTSYTGLVGASTTGPNTETTALVALALELIASPSATC